VRPQKSSGSVASSSTPSMAAGSFTSKWCSSSWQTRMSWPRQKSTTARAMPSARTVTRSRSRGSDRLGLPVLKASVVMAAVSGLPGSDLKVEASTRSRRSVSRSSATARQLHPRRTFGQSAAAAGGTVPGGRLARKNGGSLSTVAAST